MNARAFESVLRSHAGARTRREVVRLITGAVVGTALPATAVARQRGQGSGNGQFRFPLRVEAAPNGTVYVADVDAHRIQRFTVSDGFRDTWGSEGSANGEFNFPYGLAVVSNQEIAVADAGNLRIQQFVIGSP